MKQTNSWRAKVHRVWLETGDGIRSSLALQTTPIACPALWTDLCTLPQVPGSACRPPLGGCHRNGSQTRVATSLASHRDARSRAHRATSGSANFPPLLTRQQRDVTLTLQACNAKKNFTRKSPCAPSDIREWRCNAGQTRPIFRQNASVSYAVEAPNDCMMLNRNSTLHFPFPLGFSGIVAPVARRSPSALQRTAVDRGAL